MKTADEMNPMRREANDARVFILLIWWTSPMVTWWGRGRKN